MEILNYRQREEMKSYGSTKTLIDYSHWHRFLETLPQATLDATETHCIIDDEYIVPFSIYQSWLRKFEGWSYGPLTENHGAWKSCYKDIEIPFNRFYQK